MPISQLAETRNRLLKVNDTIKSLIREDGYCRIGYLSIDKLNICSNPVDASLLLGKLFHYDVSLRHSDNLVIFRKDK